MALRPQSLNSEAAKLNSADEEEPTISQALIQLSTTDATVDITPTTPRRSEDAPYTTTPRRRTKIGVSIDMQFASRFNGKRYDALTGQSTMVGLKSKKILDYEVITRKCWKCEKGKPHKCLGVFRGSAKAMEPEAAVRLICKNQLLDDAGVVVQAVAGDDDASSMAAIRKNSTHHISKWSDHNHTSKNVKSALYKVHSQFPKIFKKSFIKYFVSCYGAAVKQNKNNPDGLRAALKAMTAHAFGDHSHCRAWCGYVRDPATYKHKYFENDGENLHGDAVRQALEKTFERYAARAESIAPGASSQKNEAVNNVFISKSEKRIFTGGTWHHTYAIASGVAQTNLGTTYQKNVYNCLKISPSTRGLNYRVKRDVWRKKVAVIKAKEASKIRRKILLKRRNRLKQQIEGTEGTMYESGMGFKQPISDSVRSGGIVVPVEQRPLPEADEVKFVFFDVESDGHGNIVEIGAKSEDGEVFQMYAYPTQGMTASASEVNNLTLQDGELCYKGHQVQCTSLHKVLTSFFEYSNKFSAPIVLVVHNAHSDAYALIKGCADFYLLPKLSEIIIGFSDTLPLLQHNDIIRKDFEVECTVNPQTKKQPSIAQNILASKYVPNFRSEDAHGALYEAEVLQLLCTALDVTRLHLFNNIKLLCNYVNRQIELSNRKLFSPGLAGMLSPDVTQNTISKMAEKAITFTALKEKLNEDGEVHFSKWLKQFNNRKRTITAILNFMKIWHAS